MKFPVEKKSKKNIGKFIKIDVDLARKFATILYKEFGTFIKAIILFGSTLKSPERISPKKDIDILVILDDVTVQFSKEVVETYRIISEKAIADTAPDRLHVQSMKFTAFWEYARVGDPVAINILRNGLALVDTGFFDPLQALLDQGRIRPSDESIYTYFTMAPASILRSKQHLLTAVVDLYWATIDAAHAALMRLGEIPPTPDHVADLLERKLVAKKHVSKKYANIMRKLYFVYKKIVHREVQHISGKQYEEYLKLAEKFINGMKKYIEKK